MTAVGAAVNCGRERSVKALNALPCPQILHMTHLSSRTESLDTRPAAEHVRVAARRARGMIGFLTIFGAAVSGYAGVGIWAILFTALGLFSLSQARYSSIYRRADSLGLGSAAQPFLLISALNAVATTAIAYAAGLGFQYI